MSSEIVGTDTSTSTPSCLTLKVKLVSLFPLSLLYPLSLIKQILTHVSFGTNPHNHFWFKIKILPSLYRNFLNKA